VSDLKTMINPINTESQIQHELEALEIFNLKEIQQQKEQVRKFWLDLVKPSEVMLSCFDDAFEEVMFGAVIWALNQDPNFPKVITISRVPHRINDQNIPGSRWGIDNPDSIYRVIPIGDCQSYVIRGKLGNQLFNENHFTLWDEDMKTIGLISGNNLKVDSENNFEIFVNPDRNKEEENHIQTSSGAKEFYIRDTMIDWLKDRPNKLDIEIIEASRSAKKFDSKMKLEIVKTYMQKWAANTTRWNQQALSKPVNEFSFKIDRDTDGALRNQVYLLGHFALPSSDHCIKLDIHLDGAKYFIAPITNIWGTTNNIVTKNGSLNNSQATVNQDGTYTFILSVNDPGVFNWLDPSGLSEGILTLRWSGFPNEIVGENLFAKSQLMLIDDALNEISDDHKISNEDRLNQLKEREESYRWRTD
tara:strand:- start:227 stop:1477 length:1251 start_codon:yes stop_codon:yes gene_type:complete